MSAISIDFELQHWTSETTAIVEIARMGFGTKYQMALLRYPGTQRIRCLKRSHSISHCAYPLRLKRDT
ncbi:Uncharacterised protein [Nocardia asteroides]|nr:hypothetical protein SAMN05444423_1011456 [Nocardia asteroides]VEG37829.1 Uncharacterised protein [Nocardia asteroides]